MLQESHQREANAWNDPIQPRKRWSKQVPRESHHVTMDRQPRTNDPSGCQLTKYNSSLDRPDSTVMSFSAPVGVVGSSRVLWTSRLGDAL